MTELYQCLQYFPWFFSVYLRGLLLLSLLSSNQIKIKIKSLLLSHHHSTSALVSEILMSVLQTVQKKQQTIYIWTGSAKKKTALEHLQCSRQCKKTTTTIYIWTDSAKKQQTIYIWTDSAKKQQTIYIWTDSAKKQQTIYIRTDSAKKQQTIDIWTDSAKKTTNNLHMERQCKKTALEHLQCSITLVTDCLTVLF